MVINDLLCQTMVEQFEEKSSVTVFHKHPILTATMITVFTFSVFLTFGLLYGVMFVETVQVITKEGPIEGFYAKNILGRNIRIFLGIPYAEPPIGKLRFKKPVQKRPWNKTLKVTKQPNVCPQSFDGVKNLILNSLWKETEEMKMSEDCLYLNIYVPTAKEMNRKRMEHCMSNNEIKAVMVYFHGGSFQYGANSFKLFDATHLAALGDVIVVIPNYRLGILGFLSSQPHINGNFGLYDQLEALKWVQRNIGAFGGDPDRVVLFGQDAGAISIGLHLVSPLSKNLFRRAILESGNSLSVLTALNPENGEELTIKVANISGCPFVTSKGKNDTETYSINEATIDCLIKVPAPKIIQVQNQILAKVPVSLFTPVVDGQFYIDPPIDTVDRLKFGPYSELLIGSNAMEGVSIIRSLSGKMNYTSLEKLRKNFTKPEIKKKLLEKVPEPHQDNIDLGLDEAFPGDELNVMNATEMWFRFVKIIGDLLQVCTNEYLITKLTESGRNVYYYNFKYKPSKPVIFKYDNWFNLSDNFDETPFVFGHPLGKTKSFTQQEVVLSKRLMLFWSRFAKTGKPAAGNKWPEFDLANPQHMSLDINSTKMMNGLTGFKCEPYFRMFYNMVKEKIQQINLNTLNVMDQTDPLSFFA